VLEDGYEPGASATLGVDIRPTSGTVVWPASDRGDVRLIHFAIPDDGVGEGFEWFRIELSPVSGPAVLGEDAQRVLWIYECSDTYAEMGICEVRVIPQAEPEGDGLPVEPTLTG
jgi:hypothetical protein